jgi:hypothetical protein
VKVDLPLLRLGFLLGQEEMESSEGLKLLVELLDSSLMKLVLLFEKEVIGSLMKIKSPLEQKMVQLLVNLHAEGRGFHRVIHQYFFCKCQIKGKCQCEYWSLRKRQGNKGHTNR